MIFDDWVRQFLKSYSGPQLAITAVGAGTWLNTLTNFPGSAAIVYTVHAPYSVDAVRKFIEEVGVKYPEGVSSVSKEMLEALHEATKIRYPECAHVVITGAVVSQRYRRGLDHAYVAINNAAYHVSLAKASEEQHAFLSAHPDLLLQYRREQDSHLSSFCLTEMLCQQHSGPKEAYVTDMITYVETLGSLQPAVAGAR